MEEPKKFDWNAWAVPIICIMLVAVIAFFAYQYYEGDRRLSSCNKAILDSKSEECYWSQVTLANRIAACGIEKTDVIGGGCGRLVYYLEDTPRLIVCNYTDCTMSNVIWHTKYAFEEEKDYEVVEKVIYCPQYGTWQKGANNNTN